MRCIHNSAYSRASFPCIDPPKGFFFSQGLHGFLAQASPKTLFILISGEPPANCIWHKYVFYLVIPNLLNKCTDEPKAARSCISCNSCKRYCINTKTNTAETWQAVRGLGLRWAWLCMKPASGQLYAAPQQHFKHCCNAGNSSTQWKMNNS